MSRGDAEAERLGRQRRLGARRRRQPERAGAGEEGAAKHRSTLHLRNGRFNRTPPVC
jgi:hypothetical protein